MDFDNLSRIDNYNSYRNSISFKRSQLSIRNTENAIKKTRLDSFLLMVDYTIVYCFTFIIECYFKFILGKNIWWFSISIPIR